MYINQRKFSQRTSVIRKVESPDPDAFRSEVAREIAKGTSVLRVGSPRVRHGFATVSESSPM